MNTTDRVLMIGRHEADPPILVQAGSLRESENWDLVAPQGLRLLLYRFTRNLYWFARISGGLVELVPPFPDASIGKMLLQPSEELFLNFERVIGFEETVHF